MHFLSLSLSLSASPPKQQLTEKGNGKRTTRTAARHLNQSLVAVTLGMAFFLGEVCYGNDPSHPCPSEFIRKMTLHAIAIIRPTSRART